MGEKEINRDAVRETMIADAIRQVAEDHAEELAVDNFGEGSDLTTVVGWMLECVDNRTPGSLEQQYGLPAAEVREMMRQITHYPSDGVGLMPDIIRRLKQAAVDSRPHRIQA
jgi:hypothetical protein